MCDSGILVTSHPAKTDTLWGTHTGLQASHICYEMTTESFAVIVHLTSWMAYTCHNWLLKTADCFAIMLILSLVVDFQLSILVLL